MRRTLNIANIIFNIGFLCSMFYLVFILNNLHITIYNQLFKSNVIETIYLILGIGAVAILLNNILMNSTYGRDIIYVDKIISNSSESEGQIVSGSKDQRVDVEAIQKKISSIEGSGTTLQLDRIVSCICTQVNAGQGVLYEAYEEKDGSYLRQISSYAYVRSKDDISDIAFGEGLAGLAAKEDRLISIDNVPESYLNIVSGLGSSTPLHILILPLRLSDKVVGVLELALFWSPNEEENNEFYRLSPILAGTVVRKS